MMKKTIIYIFSLALLIGAFYSINANSEGDKMDTATFGAGCFWGVEANFQKIPGVISTDVGYAGGDVDNPTYKQVCYENTRHAEVVYVEFDPDKVSFKELCVAFFSMHDPTTLNRQGPDRGDQYRSVIFYNSETQREVAEGVKTELNSSKFNDKIVTFIVPFEKFWIAEDYHQDYYKNRGISGCGIN
jgi:peptide-methionine (S)-S-oxide reductase